MEESNCPGEVEGMAHTKLSGNATDEFTLYKRVLTETERAWHYNNRQGRCTGTGSKRAGGVTSAR